MVSSFAVCRIVGICMVLALVIIGGERRAGAQEDAGVHQPAIDALRESIDGIFAGTGCNDGVGFCHGEPLLRWEMAVWLVRVLDGVDPPEPAVSRFSDVDDSEWWMAYVERLAELEVTRGCAADPPSFCPNNPVSRAQMASFLVRAFEISEAQAAGFDDVRGGAHAGDIDALAAAGITVGCGVDPWRYCPQDDVQRGQMASFLARTLGLVPIPSVKRNLASDAGVHQPAIDALRESIDGIFAGTGCNDGVGFCHGEPLLRWEMAVWLVRVLDGVDPPEPAVSRFSDVDDAEWWMAYVERLAELEVTRGCAADPPSFCPNNPVSRAQMASFLVRAFEISEAQAAGFDDVRGGAHAGDIDALAAAGITVGCGVDPWRYCPQDDVQRGQMASFLARTLGLVPIPSVKRSFASIESSWLHSCGLRTDGRVECWGFNGDGRADAPGGVFSQVSAGGYHSCGLRTDGGVECWGLNGDGQVDAPGGVFSQVSAGGNHSCGLRIDGGVECWGRNADGQADAPGGVFSQVSAGAIHTCGLRTDGRVECWGLDLDGQTSAPRSAFRSVSAGGRHSCGVRTDGLVECWGPNEAGQIDVPRAAFVAVSVGAFHSCGLKTDGRIECWGLNSGGSTNTPASTFSSVTAGGLHSCGILTDGHAECWGRNDANQLEIPGS